MAEGMVKWFNNTKGWGFILLDDTDEDVFVHYSQIEGEGFRTLRQGERVRFELRRGPKGCFAEQVVRLEAPTEPLVVSRRRSEPPPARPNASVQPRP